MRYFFLPRERRAAWLKESFRSTLIPFSTSPVTRIRSVRRTYFPCSFRVPLREELRDGRITRMTKTLPKVRAFRSAHIRNSLAYRLDATALDIWVLDQLKTLFRNATTDKALDAQLRAPQVVFFLHLLGLDTTGHSYRPHSKVLYVHASYGTQLDPHPGIGIHEQHPRCR